MKVLALIIALFVVIHVCFAGPGGPGGQPPEFDCTGKVGFFADLWRNCEVYYQCNEKGEKKTYGCPYVPEQTYFDESTIQCVTGDLFTCPDPEPV